MQPFPTLVLWCRISLPSNGNRRFEGLSIFQAAHALVLQVWELEASLDAKKAVCDRLERQLQLSANQMQRQHDVEERYSEAQRKLRSAESSIQELQVELQVSLFHVTIKQQKQRKENSAPLAVRYENMWWAQALCSMSSSLQLYAAINVIESGVQSKISSFCSYYSAFKLMLMTSSR